MARKQSYTYQWIKNVRHIPEFLPPGYWVTLAVTAHGRFPFYCHRFQITDNERCPCGEETSSFDHYLESCNITKKERRTLNKKFKKHSRAKYERTRDKNLVVSMQEMVQWINEKNLSSLNETKIK